MLNSLRHAGKVAKSRVNVSLIVRGSECKGTLELDEVTQQARPDDYCSL